MHSDSPLFGALLFTLGAALCTTLTARVEAQSGAESGPPVPEWARQSPSTEPATEPAATEPAAAPTLAPAPPLATEMTATTDWPRSNFRGLPPCAPGQLIPRERSGVPYTCHPPSRDPGLEVGRHFWMGAGVGFDAADNVERNFAGGVDLSLWPARWLGFGAEWLVQRARNTAHDRDGDGVVDEVFPSLRLHAFTGRVLFRRFYDEAARRSVGFFVQGGYAVSLTERAQSHPLVGFGLTLTRGSVRNGTTAVEVELALRYLQGLGEAGTPNRSVLLTFGLGPVFRLHAPRNYSEAHAGGPFRFSLGVAYGTVFGTGAWMNGEVALGLNIHRFLEPRLRVELGALRTDDARSNARAPFSRFVTGSLGLRGFLGRRRFLFVEGGAGAIGVFGDTPQEVGPGAFVDARVGVQFATCGVGVALSGRYRAGIAGPFAGEHYISVGLEFGLGSYERLTIATCGARNVGANPAPRVRVARPVTPAAEAQLEIHVEPVTVEVIIGYVAFGGAVDMRLDVASLPLAQLRGAGWIEVQVIGPPQASARASAELRAVLSREGIQVNAEAQAQGDGAFQAVKAVFTIWPPGSRPQ
ncbi:MAG: hypothetical protein AB8H86_03170 [Polyangiales bacterium]